MHAGVARSFLVSLFPHEQINKSQSALYRFLANNLKVKEKVIHYCHPPALHV